MKFALLSLALTGALMLLMGPQQLIDRQASVLKDAKTLKVTYTLQHVPGTPSEYKLTYSKPNLVLVDGPDRLVESDGKTLWEYDKKAKIYTESPATAEAIAKKAQADEVLAWACFFSADAVKNLSGLQSGASRTMRGNAVTEVSFVTGGATPRSVTLYIDDKLGIARGMSLKSPSGDLLALASQIEIGADALTSDKFAFSAPEGATKAAAPSADALNWASVQPIFANNCTPCHLGRGRAGFSIASYESVMKGSEDGPVITPGDPDNSRIIQFVSGLAQPKMPPNRDLAPENIEKLKAWIKAGAKE